LRFTGSILGIKIIINKEVLFLFCKFVMPN
jgi:hypothetical protein